MSINDTSLMYDQITKHGDKELFSVWFKGKEFGTFSSRVGAEEYLEVLRNGSDEIVPGGIEEEEIRTVPKVHGVLQGSGSTGSYQSRKRTYPELL